MLACATSTDMSSDSFTARWNLIEFVFETRTLVVSTPCSDDGELGRAQSEGQSTQFQNAKEDPHKASRDSSKTTLSPKFQRIFQKTLVETETPPPPRSRARSAHRKESLLLTPVFFSFPRKPSREGSRLGPAPSAAPAKPRIRAPPVPKYDRPRFKNNCLVPRSFNDPSSIWKDPKVLSPEPHDARASFE